MDKSEIKVRKGTKARVTVPHRDKKEYFRKGKEKFDPRKADHK